MEIVYNSNEIKVNFCPHILGSFYQVVLSENRVLTFEENCLDQLARQEHEGLSKTIQLLDSCFYSTLTFSEVGSISSSLKKVKKIMTQKLKDLEKFWYNKFINPFYQLILGYSYKLF